MAKQKVKIKSEHFQKAMEKFQTLSKPQMAALLDTLLGDQPKIDGQLASLIVQEKIPARNAEGAFEMVLTIMQALQYSGYKLPFLTHEIFEKEQSNILSLYRMLTDCETDVL